MEELKQIRQDINDELEIACPICLVCMVEPITFPCKHSFCRKCTLKVFQTKVQCPMCRAIPPASFELKVNN